MPVGPTSVGPTDRLVHAGLPAKTADETGGVCGQDETKAVRLEYENAALYAMLCDYYEAD
jgi:hypothetical protein